eukprot:TRINITY_DN2680_c0_g1_i7.p1 TRINITY_DN2680_c0_g1~~TRINITY_DN2680_c0_g1_i7.p1  ORF type:complete len:188 (+),score=21.06 TRINITY_DN2680_c0_g1_i7:94-657(+)
MEYMNDAMYLPDKINTRLTPVKSEIKMKSFLFDILEGLEYVHSNGIIHCDIKLENLLRHKTDDDAIGLMKISDFGLSHKVDPATKKAFMDVQTGSFSYLAPEARTGAYIDEKLDMWSLGICLYQMSVAYKPTAIGGYKYGTGPIPFRKVDWRKRSPELQDLVVSMLQFDPEKRISSKEALQHPWFSV